MLEFLWYVWQGIAQSMALKARVAENVFLKHGATAWVLRTCQIGGDDPTIEPFVPNV
jgi:predicted Abi (CAAX) family protease